MRIYHYYLPVYFWCLQQLAKHREGGAQTALVVSTARLGAAANSEDSCGLLWVPDRCSPMALGHCALQLGISAPQGCGKSTLVEQLQQLLISNGYNTANASIDDFYLRFQVGSLSSLEAQRCILGLLQLCLSVAPQD